MNADPVRCMMPLVVQRPRKETLCLRNGHCAARKVSGRAECHQDTRCCTVQPSGDSILGAAARRAQFLDLSSSEVLGI